MVPRFTRCKRRRALGAAGVPAKKATFDRRWQVVKHKWTTELREALRQTKGNLELAVAIAATMVFAD